MDFLLPASMLAFGFVAGAASLWFISRTKLKYEFDRGRAEGETERATLIERRSGKGDQLHDTQIILNREKDESERLRGENAPSLANLLALQTRLEDERRASQEKLALLSSAEEKITDAFKALSADALRHNNRSFLDLAKQNLETFQ